MVRYLFAYYIHGFHISSAYSLTGVVEAIDITTPDITIKHGNFIPPPLKLANSGVRYHIDDDSIYLYWEGIANFQIIRGQQINVMPEATFEPEQLQRFIKTSVLASALYQRGLVVLHASAVVIDGKAVVFCGDSGCGKSTLCAKLHARGHHLLADDVVVCQPHNSGYLVHPGVQEFKLWPDTLHSLEVNHAESPRVSPDCQKRVHVVGERLHGEAAQISGIYILDWGVEDVINAIPPVAVAMELVRNSYGIRVLQSIDSRRHFEQTMDIAQSIPVRLFRRKSEHDNFAEEQAFADRRKYPRYKNTVRNARIFDLIEQDVAGL